MRTLMQNHQTLRLYEKLKLPNYYSDRIATVPISDHSVPTSASITTYDPTVDDFSKEMNKVLDDFSKEMDQLFKEWDDWSENFFKELDDLSVKDPRGSMGSVHSSAYDMRNKGVGQYKKYDIEIGGKRPTNWSPSEREQIKKYGKVKSEGHESDWKHETDKSILDTKATFRERNQNRVTKQVIKNELKGLGLAVAIGVGIGFSLSMITQLAKTGISPKSLKNATVQSAKVSIESGGQAALTYGIGRLAKLLANMSKGMAQTTIIGSLTIAALSAYQFAKLKQSGVSTRKALSTVGKETQVSLVMLAVSVIAQGVWAPAANIVMLTIGLYMISRTVWSSKHQREIMEKIQIYTIEKHYPSFAQ